MCADEAHTKVKNSATNLKMDKTEAIKYLQKKDMTPKKIHEDIVQTLA